MNENMMGRYLRNKDSLQPYNERTKLLWIFPGIYHHTTGKSMGWHAVRIVGYGNGYWLATNSWNPEWGDHGTFRIKSFANECSSEEEGFDATEPKIS